MRPLAREPAGACPALRVGRWVYEKALWGGRPAQLGAPTRQPSRASTVPIHQSPLLRGALRSAGVLTIAARTTTVGSAGSGPEPPPRRATVKNPEGAREHPDRAEGWALWVTGGSPHLPQSHRGYRRVGEALSSRSSTSGPPLGALRRCLRVAKAPRPRLPTALWGIQKGKADAPSGEPWRYSRASRGGARAA
ncbi:hypothetical protein QBC44DRAFT_391861 [Cladorrhinum sp. PSN332]|nr:hypothetical protein QBC44DRAFT_391861 [Cladorrhinum sp. PSN332]